MAAGLLKQGKTVWYSCNDESAYKAGGQVGDVGTLTVEGGVCFEVKATRKQADIYFHQGRCLPASAEEAHAGVPLKIGNTVDAEVNFSKRKATERNHSATHLLHAALKRILGDHVIQKGSLVEAERLRFDFAHFEPMTLAEIEKLEQEKKDLVQVLGREGLRYQQLEEENRKLKFMIDEGLGWEDMQQDSMQSHIN